MGKEKLAGLVAGGIVTPYSFPLRFTNLISEPSLLSWNRCSFCCAKFLKLSDLRQTQYSLHSHPFPPHNCTFPFGYNNTPIASARCQGRSVSCHLGSSELQSWATEVNGACFQVLHGKAYLQLRSQCSPICQLVRGNVEEVRNSYCASKGACVSQP